MSATLEIRPALPGDADDLLTVSDEATVWLVERGMSARGEPPSSEPAVEDAYDADAVASRVRPGSRGTGAA